MSTESSSTYEFYQVGGSLPKDAPTYVERQADTDLYNGLKESKLCYVLNSRQMGKSSLRVRMMQELERDGVACASLDITAMGNQGVTPEQWYAGLVRSLVIEFNLGNQFNFRIWWRERELLPPVQRLGEFVSEVLLTGLEQDIVIFVDEIDSVLSLNFPIDDFFAFIRACYNQRVDKPAYQRLTFALFGVATPSDLIQEKTRTPFNVGKAIELCGFQLHEVEPLTGGLAKQAQDPHMVLREVLYWTGGQPFLTQKLCQLVRSSNSKIPIGEEAKWVEHLVQTHMLKNWEAQDEPEHLRTVRDRILRSERKAGQLLGVYQQILCHGDVHAEDSPVHMELRLSGLVVKQQGKLQIYNQIYANVFNPEWIEQELANLRPYSEAISAWLESQGQDESRLLRGQALQEAWGWAGDKILGPNDYRFLNTSQDFERREIEAALVTERQANELLKEAEQKARMALEIEQRANQLLKEAEQKAKRRIRNSVIGLVMISGIAAVVGVQGWQAGAGLRAAQEKENILERKNKKSQEQLQQAQQHQKQAIAEMGKAQEQSRQANNKRKAAEDQQKTALEQVQIAQLKVSKAEQVQQQANQRAQQAQLMAAQSQEEAVNAKQEQRNAAAEVSAAQQEQKRIRASTELERRGNALLRLQPEKFNDLEPLLVAMTLGQELRNLMRRSSIPNDLQQYPAISPLLALRMAVYTIKQSSQFQGRSPKFSPDGKLVVTEWDDGSRLYDLSGKQLAQLQGRFPRFSLDGKLVVTEWDDGSRLYDLSGKQLAQLQGRFSRFSLDGKLVVTESNDGSRLYDLSGKQLARFQSTFTTNVGTTSFPVIRIKHLPKFSPDGKLVVTESNDGSRLYDLSGKQLAQFPGGGQSSFFDSSPEFSPNGKLVVTESDDGSRLYDLSGKQVAQFSERSLKFSPDGKLVVTESDDGSRLYDLSGKQVAQFPGGGQFSFFDSSPKFSPDGKLVVMESNDGSRLYDLSGKQVAQFSGRSPKFSPDGKLVVMESNDGSRLYDLSGKQVAQFPGRFPNFSPDGSWVVTNLGDNIYLYDLLGNQLAQFQGGQSSLVDGFPSFSPDGKLMLMASNDGSRLYDLSLGNLILKKQADNVIAFSSDGSLVVTESGDNIHLYDLSGKQVAQLQGRFPSFSPDRSLVVTELDDSSRLYDLSGKQVAQLQGHSPSFSPDGKLVVTESNDGSRLYDLSGKQVAQFQGRFPSFSPDGKLVVTESDGSSRLYDLSGKQVAQLQDSFPSFSPDGKLVVTESGDNIRLYDLSGKQVAQFQAIFTTGLRNTVQKRIIYPRSFSPDGSLVVTESDGSSRLYDLSGKQVAQLQGRSSSFSPDGSLVVTELDGSSRLYDLSGKQVAQLQGRFPSFSPDGSLVVTELDGSSRLYDLSGKQVAQLQGRSPSFSPSQKQVVTSSIEENISRIWDLSGNLLSEFVGSSVSPERIRNGQLGFTQDGQRLLTLTTDGTLRAWPTDQRLDDLLAQGCNWLKNHLSNHPEEAKKLEVCQKSLSAK